MAPGLTAGSKLSDPVVHCTLRAYGVVRALDQEVARLRSTLGLVDGQPFPPRLLRQSDEQTVVGVAALLRALRDFRMGLDQVAQWGVVAAPRFLGRSLMAAAIEQFKQSGPGGVSPLIIPHRSLHATSGTISFALGLHGPNVGAGGGPGAFGDGLLVAATLTREIGVPGVWLVATQWDPEPTPDARGRSTRPATCVGVALGLQSSWRGAIGSRLTLHQTDRRAENHRSLCLLADVLTQPARPARWNGVLEGGLAAEVRVEAEKPAWSAAAVVAPVTAEVSR